MKLLEQEALRTRWRRALDALALDTTERDDFGRSILARRLRNITVQMALLPADPEANVVSFDGTFSSWLEEQRVVDLDGVSFTLPQVQRRTAHALTLVDTYGDEWSQYFAFHRSGTVEVGAGDHGGRDWRNHQEERVRSIALTPTVARVWTMLKLAALVHETLEVEAPLHLAVGVVDTSEALLAILGEGWAEPNDFNNNVDTCGEPHLFGTWSCQRFPDTRLRGRSPLVSETASKTLGALSSADILPLAVSTSGSWTLDISARAGRG